MTIDVKIIKGDLCTKKIEMKELIPEGFKYGVFSEDFVLQKGEISDCIIVYNPNAIGCGIEISLNENNDVNLSLIMPASTCEIKDFYNIIVDICTKLKTDCFMQNHRMKKIDVIEELISDAEKSSIDIISDMNKKIKFEDYGGMFLFGALHPIAVGIKEIDIINKENLKPLEDFLNNMQQIDAYYAVPKYDKKEDGTVFGVYYLKSGTKAIVPEMPCDFTDSDSEIKEWYVSIDDKIISYDKFIDSVKNKKYYDDFSLLINVVSY